MFFAFTVLMAMLLATPASAASTRGQDPLSVSVDQPVMKIVQGHQEAQWITIRNNGTAPLEVSLYLSGDYKRSAWVDQTLVNIPPGKSARINMTVYALDEVEPGTYTLEIYANPLSSNLSASCTVSIVVMAPSVSQDTNPWYLLPLLLIPLIAGVITYRVMTRMQKVFKVFEIFLVCNDGRLIRHFPEDSDRTDDISKSALFCAIQDFTKEAFDYAGEQSGGYLREIVFGDIKVFVERGPKFHIAVVTKGTPPKDLRQRIMGIMSSVEERFGEVLVEWDGDLAPFEDIAQIGLEDLIISFRGPAVRKRPKKSLEDPAIKRALNPTDRPKKA